MGAQAMAQVFSRTANTRPLVFFFVIMPALQDMTKEQILEHLHGFLKPDDAVAISFWIISISMVAATVFFLMESMTVGAHWKTSMNVGALVTLVAAVHYFYMREFWVKIAQRPTCTVTSTGASPCRC